MTEHPWYSENQTLDGGDVASGTEALMKQPHQSTALFDNQDQTKGTILRKPGSKKLYLCFYYFGRRIEKTTGVNDTPQNRRKVRLWLDQQMDKIERGTFRFAEAFPDADDDKKAFFAQLEGSQYFPDSKDVLFDNFVDRWYQDIWNNWEESTKKDDYQQVINYWLRPYFRKMSFAKITYFEIVKFIGSLKWKTGKNAGKPLSTSRIKNILSPFHKLWTTACKQHQWALLDPFENITEDIPKRAPKKREGFRFDQAMALFDAMDPWYRPIAELMLLTGMIHSELGGLKKSQLRDGHIHIKETIVRNREKDTPKNSFRIRRIPITAAIGRCLEILLARTTGEKLVTTASGTVFRASNFVTDIWEPALAKAALPHRVPYGLRHSFVAWSLAIGVAPDRLVALMGHSSKKMIYERYGNYIEGLTEDGWRIREYFGVDFLAPEIRGQGPQAAEWIAALMAGRPAGTEGRDQWKTPDSTPALW